MANLTEISQWENVIRQLENGEAATGGADGLANIQAKQLANRTHWLKDNYLPLSGGAMTGSVVKRSDDTLSLSLFGGTERQKGASFMAMGNENKHNAGEFWAETGAIDSTFCALVGNPNGELSWAKNNVKTDLAGAGIVAKSLGVSGYIKYNSGLIIQWGASIVANTEHEVILPIAFTAGTYIVTGTPKEYLVDTYIKTIAANSFTINSSRTDYWYMYTAIGC